MKPKIHNRREPCWLDRNKSNCCIKYLSFVFPTTVTELRKTMIKHDALSVNLRCRLKVVRHIRHALHWRIQGGARDAASLGSISFILMQFLANTLLNNRFSLKNQGLAPPSSKSWIRRCLGSYFYTIADPE